jgi:vacuolar-type H+-ATPase catalytic subunit A/Vma1
LHYERQIESLAAKIKQQELDK